jgi:hypothetical protein
MVNGSCNSLNYRWSNYTIYGLIIIFLTLTPMNKPLKLKLKTKHAYFFIYFFYIKGLYSIVKIYKSN